MSHKLEIIKDSNCGYKKVLLDGKELIGVKNISINNSYQETEAREEIIIVLMDVETVVVSPEKF